MDDWGSALKIYGILFGSLILVAMTGSQTLMIIWAVVCGAVVIFSSFFGGGGGGSGGGRDGANY
jgi:hypothetical protein